MVRPTWAFLEWKICKFFRQFTRMLLPEILLRTKLVVVLKWYKMVWNLFLMTRKEVKFSRRPRNAAIHMAFSMFSGYQKMLKWKKMLEKSDLVLYFISGQLSALLQLHLHSPLDTWLQYIAQRQLQAETRYIWVWGFGAFLILKTLR